MVITVASAQDQAVITVFNALSKEAVSEVLISYGALNSERAYTDFSGKIKIQYKDTLYIKVSKAGYEVFENIYIHQKDIQILIAETSNDLGGIVITGQNDAKEVKNAPQKVTIIDQKKLRQMAAPTLKDALTNELNIRVSNDQFLGSSVSLRGVGGQNVKILIDGVPVIGRENGNVDLSQIPMNNIERIEIIEGPMSVNYGSDALGGVINIITKKTTNRKAFAGVNTYYETAGRYNVDFKAGFSKNRFNYQFDLGRYFFGGFDSASEHRSKLWKPKTQLFTTHQLGFKTGKNSFLRIQSYGYGEKLTAKGDVYINPYEAYAFDQYYFTTRWNNTIFFDKKFKKGNSLNITAAGLLYKRIKASYRKDMVTLDQQLTSNAEDQDTSKFNTYMSRGTYQHYIFGKKKFGLQTGYEYTFDMANGSKIKDGHQSMVDAAIYGNAETKLYKQLLIKGGVRYAYNNRYKAPVVSSLNFKYDPSSKVTIRMAYAKGFRTPSLKELNLYFVDANHNVQGNPNLLPERSDNITLNTEWRIDRKKTKIKIEPVLFYNYIQNMIGLVLTNSSTNEYKYENITKFTTIGGNLNASFKKDLFSANGGFSYTGFYSYVGQNQAFRFSPEFRASTSYQIKKIKTEFNLFYKYTGRLLSYQFAEDQQTVLTNETAAYHWLDLSLLKSFWKNKISISIGGKNLFNVRSIRSTANSGIHTTSGNQMPLGYGRFGFINFKLNI
jgi:outer membrane receptor for ferrienterochelin and colicins